MSNNELLTESELAQYRPHPAMLAGIERTRSRLGMSRDAFRILDWGCGRGKLVLWLREQGYNAVGVDIDPASFVRGADVFRTRRHAHEKCLFPLAPDGRAPFPDASFDFITSWQVLEHVADLTGAARELRRLTRDGGGGFHIYPPHLRLVEGHLFMPFVHWLPKNGLRRAVIGLYVSCGVEPHWWPREQMPLSRKIHVYYRYSVDETFYRSPRLVRSCFEESGFEAAFTDVEEWRTARRRMQNWLALGPRSRVIRTWYMNYGRNLGLATRAAV
jgi:SAM-dependent methyltransferase